MVFKSSTMQKSLLFEKTFKRLHYQKSIGNFTFGREKKLWYGKNV